MARSTTIAVTHTVAIAMPISFQPLPHFLISHSPPKGFRITSRPCPNRPPGRLRVGPHGPKPGTGCYRLSASTSFIACNTKRGSWYGISILGTEKSTQPYGPSGGGFHQVIAYSKRAPPRGRGQASCPNGSDASCEAIRSCKVSLIRALSDVENSAALYWTYRRAGALRRESASMAHWRCRAGSPASCLMRSATMQP